MGYLWPFEGFRGHFGPPPKTTNPGLTRCLTLSNRGSKSAPERIRTSTHALCKPDPTRAGIVSVKVRCSIMGQLMGNHLHDRDRVLFRSAPNAPARPIQRTLLDGVNDWCAHRMPATTRSTSASRRPGDGGEHQGARNCMWLCGRIRLHGGRQMTDRLQRDLGRRAFVSAPSGRDLRVHSDQGVATGPVRVRSDRRIESWNVS